MFSTTGYVALMCAVTRHTEPFQRRLGLLEERLNVSVEADYSAFDCSASQLFA